MAPTVKRKIEKGPPGRPKHEVWTLGFRRVLKHCDKTHRTIHAAFCVICNKVLCNTASKRLSAHRRICTIEELDENELIEKTENIDKLKEITKIISADSSDTITFVDMDEAQQFEQSTSESITKTEYTFIDNPSETIEVPITTTIVSNSDHKLDTAIAKFFIGCNIPFSVADSAYFQKLCLTLNPTSKIVTSDQLAGPLLDEVYSKFHKDMKISPTSVLLIDGWKSDSTNTKNVTVMIKTETSDSVFVDSYELSNNKENIVQELIEITKMSILEAYEKFKTEVFAVIMGNSCSMMKIDDINEVWQFPCNLHIVKLLIKDYIAQDFMNTICKILKQINTIGKDNELEDKISSDMRWTNTKWILEYCLTHLDVIQTYLSSDNFIKLSKDYKCLFFDEEFINKIGSCVNFLESINELTAASQNPKSNIADTAEQWLSLQITDDNPETAEKIKVRRDTALKVESLVANYLHPTYRGKRLSDEQMNRVEEFLVNELSSEGLNSLQSYVNGDSIFRVLNQKDGLSSQTYWSLARRTHSNLASLALKLFTVPASITSNFSQIFNTIRNNSLKAENLRKFIAVYYHLKQKEEKLTVD